MEPASNIELKARLHNLAAARQIAERIATKYLGFEQQTDTYFHCPHGRLKLREINGIKAQLVAYRRANRQDAKQSDYHLIEVADTGRLKAVLADVLGIRVVVDKRREIFLHDNVRIHLDEVSNLGTFLEFEAVLGGGIDAEAGQAQVAQLQTAFGISPVDLLSGSYADLLLAAQVARTQS
jgi:predicted adenylyl cyclase CyaB